MKKLILVALSLVPMTQIFAIERPQDFIDTSEYDDFQTIDYDSMSEALLHRLSESSEESLQNKIKVRLINQIKELSNHISYNLNFGVAVINGFGDHNSMLRVKCKVEYSKCVVDTSLVKALFTREMKLFSELGLYKDMSLEKLHEMLNILVNIENLMESSGSKYQITQEYQIFGMFQKFYRNYGVKLLQVASSINKLPALRSK